MTATAFSYRPDGLAIAGAVHGVSWILQFLGHGLAERRAPALLDNLLGGAYETSLPFYGCTDHSTFHAAVVLAPFFAHLEILFGLGYRPQLHHDLKNSVGVEIARIRKIEADKKRAKTE